MKKYDKNNTQYTHSLNDILSNSEKYKMHANKLLDDLVFPPWLYIKELNIKPHIYLCNHGDCNKYIDNDLDEKLITLVNIYDKSLNNKSKKTNTKKHKNTRKHKNTKKLKTKN